MHIGDKIDEVRQRIIDGDQTLANIISRAGLKAIFTGIGQFDHNGVVTNPTFEWKDLMRNFANDQKELDRLCGKEAFFNRSDWGLACLAYIAGDSTCTSDTTATTGTKRSMLAHEDRQMLENLDAEQDDLQPFNNGSVFTKIE